jgi:hypothetical protein
MLSAVTHPARGAAETGEAVDHEASHRWPVHPEVAAAPQAPPPLSRGRRHGRRRRRLRHLRVQPGRDDRAVANLLAVAVLPVIAGITGDRFYDPAAMTHGFHVAMLACTGLAAAGGAVAWLTISDQALAAPTEYSCPVAGPPLRPADGAART